MTPRLSTTSGGNLNRSKRRQRGRGMWAERLVQTRLGMEPLSQARALKGSYRPDGKISTDYLVSVKSAERTALRISLDEWLVHHAAALHEGRRPLLVLVGRKSAPIFLVAMTPEEFLYLEGQDQIARGAV